MSRRWSRLDSGRTIAVRLAAIVILPFAGSCLPTEACACPPGSSVHVVYGTVSTAAAAPAAGAMLRFTATPYESCAEDPVALAPGTVTSTNSAGAFRVVLRSLFSPGTRCVRITAFASATAGSDSVALPPMLLNFVSDRQTPDSLGLVLTLP